MLGLDANLVHTWADQLLPQLLIKQFDTLPIQCRHIEHMHEGVWFRKNNFCLLLICIDFTARYKIIVLSTISCIS